MPAHRPLAGICALSLAAFLPSRPLTCAPLPPLFSPRCDGGKLHAYDVTVWQPRQLPASPGSALGAGTVRNCVALAADKTEGRVWTGHSDGTVSVWSVPTGRARVPAIAVFDEPCVSIAVVGSGMVWVGSRSGRLAALEFQSDAPPASVGTPHTRHTGEIFPDDYGEYSQELLAALSTLQVVGYPQWVGDGSRASHAPVSTTLAKASGQSGDGGPGGCAALGGGPAPRFTGRLACLTFEADRMWGARGSGKRIHSWCVTAPEECEVWDAQDLGSLVAVSSAAGGGLVITCHRTGALQLWDRLGMRLRSFRSPSTTEPVEMAVCASLVRFFRFPVALCARCSLRASLFTSTLQQDVASPHTAAPHSLFRQAFLVDSIPTTPHLARAAVRGAPRRHPPPMVAE